MGFSLLIIMHLHGGDRAGFHLYHSLGKTQLDVDLCSFTAEKRKIQGHSMELCSQRQNIQKKTSRSIDRAMKPKIILEVWL